MSRETLTAQARDASGKSPVARRLRATGRVPGVIYGGKAPIAFSVNILEAQAALRHGATLIEMKVDGDSYTTIVKDYQVHPVRGTLQHLDLQEVDLKQAIRFTVPVQLVGESPGVKGGGLLTQSIHEVEVETTPANIPDAVGADISGLDVGDTLSLGSLTVPEGAIVVGDPELTVISISASRATRAAALATTRAEQQVAKGAEGDDESADA